MLPFRAAILNTFLIALFLFAVQQGQAAPDLQTVIYKVYVTDVRDGQFIVSWTTNVSSTGRVDWGTTTALGNITPHPVVSTTTHYVAVDTGLAPNTLYYFQVTSDSTVENNGGTYFTVTTGPTLGIPSPGKTLYGYVYQSNGTTPVSDAIVYLQLQNADASGSTGNSQWVTARTDGTGLWFFSNLNDARTSNAGSYFAFSDSTDNLRIVAQGGIPGVSGPKPLPTEVIVPVPTSLSSAIRLNS